MTAPRRPTLCTGCNEPVSLQFLHVRMAITIQALKRDGTPVVHDTNVLGTWHQSCARAWIKTEARR